MKQRYISKVLSLIKGGFFHILTGNVLIKAIAMISSIIVAKIVDKEAYAYLSYADNLYAYLSLFCGMGLPSALLIYCKYGQHSRNKSFLQFATKLGSCFELIMALILCVIVTFIPLPFSKAKKYIWALIFYPLLTNLHSTFSCYIRTQYENKLYAKASILLTILVSLFSILFVFLFDAKGVIVSRYAALIITIFYLLNYLKKNLSHVPCLSLERKEKSLFIKMGLSLMVASLFSGMMSLNEIFLVNNIIQDEIITANFKVAGFFPNLLSLISNAIAVYFFPIVSHMKDWKQIRKTVMRIGIANAVTIIILAGIGMLLTPIAIRIIYGTKYVDAIPMTYMLWIMLGMNCGIRIIPINLLPAVGKTRFNMWSAIVSCAIQIILDYWFIKKFGISGVAWGATIIYLISGIAYWIYFFYVCSSEARRNEQ